jgi:hypothetical protein
MTRRVDRVGQTSEITSMRDDSGNRACESILLYSRGLNPSVSVSYGNEGNNGGQGVNRGNNTQAYLPYRVIRDGAFRPPVMTQEQLLPLSRQPRQNTTAFTQPGFTDFSKKIMCEKDTCRAVKTETLKACVRPTMTYKIQAPLVEPFEVKYVIKDPVKFDPRAGNSNIRTRDLTTQHTQEPTKEINKNPLQVESHVNQGASDNIRYSDNSHINTDRYIQEDPLYSSITSNKSQPHVQLTPISDIMDMDLDMYTKNTTNISYTPLKTGYTKEESMHNDFDLERRVIQTSAQTNKQQNIHRRPEVEHIEHDQTNNRPVTQAFTNHGNSNMRGTNIDLNSRNYKLHPTLNPGGFDGKGQMPMTNRMQEVNENVQSEKTIMNKRIFDLQHARYAIQV